MLTNQLWR